MSKWNWIHHKGAKFCDVGILPDGTLHNSNGYPDDIVRVAVLAADERRRERHSRAAKKAAKTRRERKEKKVYATAKHYVETGDGGRIGPRCRCYICGKKLDDPDSVTRGIGSECWQDVLNEIACIRAQSTAA